MRPSLGAADRPAGFFAGLSRPGPDTLTSPREVDPDRPRLTAVVRSHGKKGGLAFTPAMPVNRVEPYLADIDLALCMTVFPGFGGQPFLPESPERIRRLRQLIDKHNPRCDLEVDGGIDLANAETVVAAGANVLVIGTGIFRYKDGPG